MKFYVKSKLSENISETPEGYLLCRNVILTHTGELKYAAGEHPFDDLKHEMTLTRKPEDLFSEETVSSFIGKSITIEHPEDWVTPENWQEETHGVVMNVRPSPEKVEIEGKEEDALIGDFLITTRKAIDEVNNGLREVSLGYDALWVQTSDNTAIHTKIIGNHCAIVENGRAGINCAIKDSKGETMSKELSAKFEKLFGKTVDAAVKEKEEADKKAADEAEAKKKAEDEAEAKKKAEEAEAEKKKATDETGKIEERLARVEAMLTEIVKAISGEAEEVVAEDEDEDESEEDESEDESEEYESEDEGSEEDLETEDSEDEEDKKKAGKAGDTMARAEILSPGIKKTKDVKEKALIAAYKTTDGRKVIKPLLGGKKISKLGSALDGVFHAASELLKEERINNHSKVKSLTIDSFPSLKQSGAMTPAEVNAANKKRYNR